MERVLDVYKRPYNKRFPVVCMDESPRQLIDEVKGPGPCAPGRPDRQDYEYKRCGVCNVFMSNEPLSGKRMVEVTERKTKRDWAAFVKQIAEAYQGAEKITLVMDNLNTHKAASFYEAFPPEKAKALWDRFEFVYTPKHGSWLNMAEIELSILGRQCLSRRIPDQGTLRREVSQWQRTRNSKASKIDWRFTTSDARIKLKKLYPSFQH